jgi:uncharacterized protein YbaR (Trm112 family)
MRYLGLSLYAEGPDDYAFLPPLLGRATQDLCCSQARENIEIGEVIPVYAPEEARNENLESKIFEAARSALGAFQILFIHTDGRSDPDRARRERIDPAVARIERELGSAAGRSVAVISVREMEAWALADGHALRRAFGTSLDNAGLGIPAIPREVERISDPKASLNQAFSASRRRRQRGKKAASDFLNLLGEIVNLSILRQVLAFKTFEDELGNALRGLHYI